MPLPRGGGGGGVPFGDKILARCRGGVQEDKKNFFSVVHVPCKKVQLQFLKKVGQFFFISIAKSGEAQKKFLKNDMALFFLGGGGVKAYYVCSEGGRGNFLVYLCSPMILSLSTIVVLGHFWAPHITFLQEEDVISRFLSGFFSLSFFSWDDTGRAINFLSQPFFFLSFLEQIPK